MSPGRWASSGPDFSEQYREQAEQLARRFAIMEGVVGVLLSGGLTLGDADRYSDIDLFVYLRQQSLRTWYFGEAPLPEGESRYHDLRLDVSYLDYEQEQRREWSTTEQWSASRARILYDPEGLLAELLDAKRPSSEELAERALDSAATIRFMLERQVPAWLYRGEAIAAHQVINRATEEFVRLVHLMNDSAGPEAGWDIVLLESLPWKPDAISSELAGIMRTGDLSTSDASRRRYALLRVLQSCWSSIAPGEPFEVRADTGRQRRMLRDLSARATMSLNEFLERYDRRLLIQSPAFDLVWIDREAEEFQVRFSHDRLQHLLHHELGRFLDDQQRLLRELAESSGKDVDS